MARQPACLIAMIAALIFPCGLSAQAAHTLEDLSFMAGCWRGDFGNGESLEETYTRPSANLILGTSRFMRGNAAVQFEFSRISADSTGIALLPYPGGRPSEHAFRLVSLEGNVAWFEAPEHDFPKRIQYSRMADGSLVARIDGGANDTRVQEWRMQPVACRSKARSATVPLSSTRSPQPSP